MIIDEINSLAEKYDLQQILTDEIKNQYIDLTQLKTYTIDEEKTYEIDDAISLEINKERTTIWIHIANPSSFIDLDSEIDIKARKKATSIYLPDRVNLMLPQKITNNLLSLTSGRLAPALSASIELNQDAEIINYSILPSIIRTDYNLTYKDADELIELKPPQEAELALLSKIMIKRYKWRLAKGAIMLEQPEGRLSYQEQDIILNIVEPTPSRMLIRECMILMGFVISDFAKNNNIAIPFRIQNESDISYSNVFNDNIQHVRNSAIKQKLSRAKFTTTPGKHFSLGLDSYVQATSPLRRYSDLIVHRQIFAKILNCKLYNKSEMDCLITEFNKRYRESLEIIKEAKAQILFKWLKLNRTNLWTTYFLRNISSKENLVLLYFNELEMEVYCNLDYIGKWGIGQTITIQAISFNALKNKVLFKVMS